MGTVPFPIRDNTMGEEGCGGARVLPEKPEDNFMRGKGMGKVTCRSLPAWGPASMQALRSQGFSDVHRCLLSAWS